MLDAVLAYISYDPVQRLGPVSPHGIGTAGGFLLGAMLMARRAEPRGIPRSEVYNAVTWGAVGAILGARGFYVLAHADQFGSLRDVFAVWEGGLTMFGGFVGGLALGLWYLYRKGFDIPLALDAAAPGFVAGVIVGRVGDIVIADHLGRPTDFFLGYRIPAGADLAPGYGPPTYVAGEVVHHTAVYDLIGAFVLTLVLAALARRRLRTGSLFAVFALWYGLQRYFLDFTRNREVIESFFFGLSGSQWAGLLFALGGAVALARIHTRRPQPEEEPRPVAATVPATVPPDPPASAQRSEAPPDETPPRAEPPPPGPEPLFGPEAVQPPLSGPAGV